MPHAPVCVDAEGVQWWFNWNGGASAVNLLAMARHTLEDGPTPPICLPLMSIRVAEQLLETYWLFLQHCQCI